MHYSVCHSSCRSHCARRSRGFTLVELLVVMTIIGILMSLLIPAVQRAREAARVGVCLSNLRQIGLAALAHEHQYNCLPTGGWGTNWAGDPTMGYSANQPGGFFYNILPFIDQANLWAYGQPGLMIPNASGVLTQSKLYQTASMPVAIYNCPTRRPLGALPIASSLVFYTGNSGSAVAMNTLFPGSATGLLARSDYAVCGGDADKWSSSATDPTKFSQSQPPSLKAGLGQLPTWSWSNILMGNFNGICAPHTALQPGAITRGRSALFLVGEKYLNPDSYLNGQDLGDNSTWDMGYDVNVVRWSGGYGQPPTASTPPANDPQFLPMIDKAGTAQSYAFGSAHTAGFGMCFCDGSTRSLNYNIDPRMYGYLGCRTLTTDKDQTSGQLIDVIDDSKW